MTSLSDKEKILKEPLSLYEQEAFYKKDVKEAIKELKKKLDPFMYKIEVEQLLDEIFGAELCSEEKSE